jgi:peroxiredoxin
MKLSHLVVAIVAALGILGGALVYFREEPAPGGALDALGRYHRLRPAPEFALKDARGKEHRLADFRGSLVILHFWASWCPPCLEEIGEFKEAAAKYTGVPVKWVAVSVDQSWEDAHRILPEAALPPNLVSLLDPRAKTPDRFGTYQYPETYLIDRQLRVAAKWVGAKDWTSPELRQVLEAVAAAGD